MKYKFFIVLAVMVFITKTSIAAVSMEHKEDSCQSLTTKAGLPAATSQVIRVHGLEGFKAELTVCQRQNKEWKQILTPSWMGTIGENGIAPIGEKKEGDLKTPAGLYALGDAFGTQPMSLKLDYKYITSEDKFIDDVNHKDYNTWVNGNTDAKSYESMLNKSYKMGVVIHYNMDPIIPGAGSAIFMHLHEEPNIATSGCVAMDERHLLAILQWLDKKQHPYILID